MPLIKKMFTINKHIIASDSEAIPACQVNRRPFYAEMASFLAMTIIYKHNQHPHHENKIYSISAHWRFSAALLQGNVA
jgi:hypothetical protein